MDIKHYQGQVARTMNKSLDMAEALANYGLGLGGEAGEVTEPIKKFLYHEHVLDKRKVADELADVIWYAAALANTLGEDLGEALERNVAKLRDRYPNGFNPQDSIHRKGD